MDFNKMRHAPSHKVRDLLKFEPTTLNFAIANDNNQTVKQG